MLPCERRRERRVSTNDCLPVGVAGGGGSMNTGGRGGVVDAQAVVPEDMLGREGAYAVSDGITEV